MPIYQLREENFRLVGHSKKSLVINVPGVVLVFFKMARCDGCRDFTPIFERLAGTDTRLKYAVVNLDDNRNVVKMSHSSTTPIQTVPYILMYVDTKPKAIYKGKRDIPSLQSFIGKFLSQSSSSFMPSRGYPTPPPKERVWMPEGLKEPAGSRQSPYAQLGGVEEEDDEKLKLPADITPYNFPWESKYVGLEK